MLDNDAVSKLAEHIPFLLAAGEGRAKLNWTRLFEIGIVLGALYMQINGLKEEVKEVKAAVEQIRHDLYIPRSRHQEAYIPNTEVPRGR